MSQSDTRAEYRAFELAISNSTTNQSQVVLTTLDPEQYPIYYMVHRDEILQMTATWMCKGRTDGFQAICERPAPKQAMPAANTNNSPNAPTSAEAAPSPLPAPAVKVAKP